MTQTVEGAFKLIGNMAASSENKLQEHYQAREVNSVEAKWRDDLTTKVNFLLERIQGDVCFVDESVTEQPSSEAVKEVSQGKTCVFNQEQNQFQPANQQKPQTASSKPLQLLRTTLTMS